VKISSASAVCSASVPWDRRNAAERTARLGGVVFARRIEDPRPRFGVGVGRRDPDRKNRDVVACAVRDDEFVDESRGLRRRERCIGRDDVAQPAFAEGQVVRRLGERTPAAPASTRSTSRAA
jgi:hypothetical protein